MKPLKILESKSIFIIREAFNAFNRLGLLWSAGKDSTVLLWLTRKAFFGNIPVPLIHIDTSFKFSQMIHYRNELVRELKCKLIVGMNHEAIKLKQTFPDGKVDRKTCCHQLKSQALRNILKGGARSILDLETGDLVPDPAPYPFEALILGIRADEEGTRAKEKYFSPRDSNCSWNFQSQPPELWDFLERNIPAGGHMRIHPLLDWTEQDIWEYIEEEKIPILSLYCNQGDGFRYRSLGCIPCTQPIASLARNTSEIVEEFKNGAIKETSERATRAQDDQCGLESLRLAGYM